MGPNILKVLKILYRTVPDHTDFYDDPFKILIATVISQRTKDSVTAQSSKKLFDRFKTVKELSEGTVDEISSLIYPAGFYREKARRIKEIANIIDRSGIVPDDLDALLKLPGVGRKTANIVLSAGFNIDTIAVDTHVHRITNRLGWVHTKNPEDTETELKKIIPKEYWHRLNGTLVVFGQNVCKPVSPKCKICPVNKYCPSRKL
ncbi:MAG: endonuclease III domain-containing protein [Thermoplasmata archaeon]